MSDKNKPNALLEFLRDDSAISNFLIIFILVVLIGSLGIQSIAAIFKNNTSVSEPVPEKVITDG